MRRSLTSLLCVLALFCTCQFPGCPKGPLEVQPDAAHPGRTIRLHQNNGGFLAYDSLRVIVGRHVAYARITGNNDVAVMVPLQAPAGSAAVRLFDGPREAGASRVAVLDPLSIRVLMVIDAAGVKVLGAEPCADAITGDVPSREERVSFDMIDSAGNLLHTGSVLHPLKAERETFARNGETAAAGRTPPSSTGVFWVQVPNLPSTNALRVYSVPRGVSLADSTGRAARVPLNVETPGQGFLFRIGP